MGQYVIFAIPAYLYIILNKEHLTFHLQYKHYAKFANCKYEKLSHHKYQKMCDPILATLLKMRPHDSQSSHENATPSSGTSPLASYKEVPTHPTRAFYVHVVLNGVIFRQIS